MDGVIRREGMRWLGLVLEPEPSASKFCLLLGARLLSNDSYCMAATPTTRLQDRLRAAQHVIPLGNMHQLGPPL